MPAPSESYVANALDCDDEDATVYSGASELCDGQINNCVTGALPANESDDDGDGVRVHHRRRWLGWCIGENGW